MVQRVTTSDGQVIVGETFHGAQSGVPLVLLHGLSQQRRFWLPVIRRLPGIPIIAVDLRGHGDADAPPQADYLIGRCAQDVLEYLDGTGVGQIILGGHSWGASVALHLAALDPERVVRLVLLDGAIAVPSQLGDPQTVRDQLTPPRIAAPSLDTIFARMAAGPLGSSWSAEVVEALTPTFARRPDGTWGTRIGFERHMRVLDDFLTYDPLPDWERLQVPTVLVCCQNSGRWRDVRQRNVEALPEGSPIEVLDWPDAIHDVPLQDPNRIADLFDSVWRSVHEGGR